MKICHVITTLVYGGAERLLMGYANRQAANHKVHVVYLKGDPVLAKEFHPSVIIHHVPLDPRAPGRLRALFLEIKPDILHTNLGHADLIGLWAARGLPVKRFCTMANIWFKWNWTDYAYFVLYRILFDTVARNCVVICISRSVKAHVRRRLGVRESHTRLLYNAIPKIPFDGSAASFRNRLGISHQSFVVLFVGRLRLQKSVDTLIRAAALARMDIPKIKVLVVGEGPEKSSLEKLSAGFGLSDCVEFRGTTANPEAYMAAADVFVLPSIFEGFGIVLIESFRAGLCVVASAVEGPKELIENDRNGLLFPPRDAERLAQCLVRLHGDPVLRHTLAMEGKSGFSERFTMDYYAESLEKIYTETA